MERFCPICQKYSEKFKSFGFNPREDAQCPHCGSLERHRMTWLYILNETGFTSTHEKTLLHIAPEPIFQQLFQHQLKENYLSADLFDEKAMVKMDITDIDFQNESFDHIYCSHVLEHIIDDQKAMSELHRVLKKDGWAMLLVPIRNSEDTFEDFSITDPELRLKTFGHPEHVRYYGRDFSKRLENAGFHVKTVYAGDFLSDEQIRLMGITEASGEIYFCTKSH